MFYYILYIVPLNEPIELRNVEICTYLLLVNQEELLFGESILLEHLHGIRTRESEASHPVVSESD